MVAIIIIMAIVIVTFLEEHKVTVGSDRGGSLMSGRWSPWCTLWELRSILEQESE